MLEDQEQKARVLEIMRKRNAGVGCVDFCPSFDILEVGPGQMMYYCNRHGFKGMCVV